MIVVLKTDVPGGIGRKLRDLASGKTPVLLDGPYGAGADLTRHDTAILLAGGSGVSFVTGILEGLCREYKAGRGRTRKIIFHWVVRQEGVFFDVGGGRGPVSRADRVTFGPFLFSASRAWFNEQIHSAIEGMPVDMVDVHLHITSSHTEKENMLSTADEEKHYDHDEATEDHRSEDHEPYVSTPDRPSFLTRRSLTLSPSPFARSTKWITHHKKPCLPCVLRSSFVHSGSIGIASCGPTTFTRDVRKAVAAKQKNMALGGRDVRDVELHTEEFEW
jgi:hypothetical protein